MGCCLNHFAIIMNGIKLRAPYSGKVYNTMFIIVEILDIMLIIMSNDKRQQGEVVY